MGTRWWTFGVWALVAASAVFWGFRLLVVAPAQPPGVQVATTAPLSRGDLSRLLGVDPPPAAAAAAAEPAADARFQLIGVVVPHAPSSAREGLALIAVDGKPARAYRIGSAVEGQTVLQAVGLRSATLGPRDGAGVVALSLIPPAPANTAILPTAGAPATAPPQTPLAQAPTVQAPPISATTMQAPFQRPAWARRTQAVIQPDTGVNTVPPPPSQPPPGSYSPADK
jgi:general secretion pathway protein C